MLNIEQRTQILSILSQQAAARIREAEERSLGRFQQTTERLNNLQRNKPEFEQAKQLLLSMGAEPIPAVENTIDFELFATYSTLNHGVYCFGINPLSPFEEIESTAWLLPREVAIKRTPHDQKEFWSSISTPSVHGAKYIQTTVPDTWSAYFHPPFDKHLLITSFNPTTHYFWEADEENGGFFRKELLDSNIVDSVDFIAGNAFGFRKIPRYLKDGYYRVLQAHMAEGIDLEAINTSPNLHTNYKTSVTTFKLAIDLQEGERQTKGKFRVMKEIQKY